MRDFACLTISPIELAHTGLAVATARAGGIAVLDREFCGEALLSQAESNLKRLLTLVADDAQVGLRLRADQLDESHGLLTELSGRAHWLIVCGWDGRSLSRLESALPSCDARTLLLEVTSAEQLSAINDETAVQGLVARGHESGGWVGDDSAFILSQKLVARQSRPVYVQGGIGLHSAAACRAVGAAGVVLDDQLWLMPESPLPANWQAHLLKLNGQEATLVGERLGAGCRVLARPGLQAALALQQVAEQLEAAQDGNGTSARTLERWREKAQSMVGWGEPDARAWPVGQAVGLAARLREQHQTTGRLIQAVLAASRQHITLAQRLKPLQADSPLAASHGTRYPIVQGPMTRVSDTAEFAEAVARAGALPLLALALMKREEVKTLLEETRRLIGEHAWGVGILGFVPQELREQQMEAVREVRPPFALIAGGRPDQSAQLEALGIATYIHVPVPALLKTFLAQGARRFVFEGRECGGHVGPLTSFMLWESMIETLLEEVATKDAAGVHLLFAGGIHDARSAMMVGAMAAPLVERGMRIGVLMGTAYLFTEEAVSRGAIVSTFQEQALACERTVNLETGPGHAIRCVTTPFSKEFYSVRQRAVSRGTSAVELRQTLEALTTGRLRLASKGLKRDGQQLFSIEADEQLREGMYMIGQVATMQSSVRTIANLHSEVSEGSTGMLLESSTATVEVIEGRAAKPSEIAIVGIGNLLPGAQAPEKFWDNILRKVETIVEIPADHWDWRLYYDAERKARDKTYSKWGGFIEDVPFDPLRFGIPPNSLKSISCSQLLTLETVRRALEDAGYAAGNFDRERTAVILGGSDGGGMLTNQYIARTMIPLSIETPSSHVWDRLPEWTEESFPGTLTNVSAGRVANRFDLGGSNFTVDAACASSLTAIDLAVNELESGRSNMVITGGVDMGQSPYYYIAFSKTQALSPRGRARTFDKSADGIVISEGVMILVLKRLADAERDGDRIYAVIKGVAGSSDGKALGLTAPRPLGQMRTIERAFKKADIKLSTIELYEAHGTGTVVGDQAELETIVSSLKRDEASEKTCAIGSVKTLIGHTKTAAGAVGLAKAALALYHKTLPPHAGVENPLDPITDPTSAVYLLQDARPWLAHPEHARRCGVSAFGFGGTNSHAVLEEYQGESRRRAPGSDAWPCELFVFRAASRAALIDEVGRLLDALEAGAEPRLRDLAFTLATNAHATRFSHGVCLALLVETPEGLREDLRTVLARLKNEQAERWPAHVSFSEQAASREQSLAFVFPGQGAQYVNMAREATVYFEELRASIEAADSALRPHYPKLLSRYIYPPGAYSENEQQRHAEELTATHIAQPSIGAVSAGFLALVQRLGLLPSMVCGHSYGEFTALYAAGALSAEDFFRLSAARGRAMLNACPEDGAMAVVHATRAEVEARLNGDRSVVIANHNAPRQTVISGLREKVNEAIAHLSDAGLASSLLPVSGPFHSPLMAAANVPLSNAIDECDWHSPRIPVYSNVTAQAYTTSAEDLRRQVASHLLSPVEFVRQIERMYEDGARVFLELGPKNILTGLIDKILDGREHLSVAVEGRGGDLRGLLLALGTLAAHGVGVNLPALFEGRDVRQLDLHRLPELTKRQALSPTAWIVNGACVRPQSEAVGHTGKLPSLTQETASQQHQPTAAQASQTSTASASYAEAPRVNNVDETAQASAKAAPQPATAAGGNGHVLAAYQAYQETMRQFLSLQEEALKHFLNLQQPTAAMHANPATAAPPFHAQSNHEQANGNGASSSSSASAIVAPTTTQEEPNHHAPKAHAEPPEVIVSQQMQAEPEALDHAALTQMLVHLVSEHTGYPPEMLGVDLDLEAELGVDSIKRIEILDAFQKRLPSQLAAAMQARVERFTKVKSLNELVETFLREVAPTAAATAQPPAAETTSPVVERETTAAAAVSAAQPAEDERRAEKARATALKRDESRAAKDESGATDDEGCPRYILKPEEEPLPALEPIAPEGLFIITEDSLAVAAHVSAHLRQRGASTALINREALASPEELRRIVRELERAHGPVKGIVHLAPLSSAALPDTLDAWRRETQIQSKSLFQLLRLCADSAASNGDKGWKGRVLNASLLGGFFGRAGECGPGLPVGGSGYGLLKTASIEWPEMTARALDFDQHLSAAGIAERVVAELLATSEQLEVGYPKGRRTIFRTVSAPLNTSAAPARPVPGAGWVLLLTGGAQGITAEAARSLAVPGMRMIIVGRSPEPVDEPKATAGIEDVGALRRIFVEQGKNNGGQPTPAKIEARLQALLKERAGRRNLASLRQAGVEVEYHALDVRDEAAFGSLVKDIYARHGRLDAVLHGAGVIEDKLLQDKSEDSFNRVFDTKVDSTFILSRYLQPATLKLLVLFSSIAGRYGNRGQADYAAANEVMNRFAWRMQESFPDARVVAINWGPWASVGMASEAVNSQFRERSIVPVGTRAGCRFLLEEIVYANRSEAEVVAGEGPWGADDFEGDDLSNLLLHINTLTENFWTM